MDDQRTLVGAWAMRNSVADALVRSEQHVRRLLAEATTEDLVALVEAFSPTRSPGPEWSRTFDPLVERVWAWARPEAIAALEASFRARGPVWMAVANAFAPENGERLRGQLHQPAWARLPALTLA
jgi:hypothetical protein